MLANAQNLQRDLYAAIAKFDATAEEFRVQVGALQQENKGLYARVAALEAQVAAKPAVAPAPTINVVEIVKAELSKLDSAGPFANPNPANPKHVFFLIKP